MRAPRSERPLRGPLFKLEFGGDFMYYETAGNPRFHIGDHVRVVDSPYNDCPFVWIDEMTLFCGKEVRIINAWWNSVNNAYAYIIEGPSCVWCANCFNEIADTIPEQTESDFLEAFDSLIS